MGLGHSGKVLVVSNQGVSIPANGMRVIHALTNQSIRPFGSVRRYRIACIFLTTA
jgi:hypothetical protein